MRKLLITVLVLSVDAYKWLFNKGKTDYVGKNETAYDVKYWQIHKETEKWKQKV